MNRSVGWLAVATSLAWIASAGAAQNASQQSPQSDYTLQAHAREVVTDVTVTDRKGNPIHGLSESAFHIFDNGKPQHLGSFEEHTRQDASAPLQESTANVYSNNIVLHPPRVFNVVVLDAIYISLPDQMYLRQQLDQFVRTLPPDEPFAIFARNSEHLIMLADFTADHEKLTKAINNELPRLITGVGLNYATADTSLMEEICTYLEQYPGRKNVLWFKVGSSPLTMELTPDPTTVAGYVDLRPLYDELEKARVALYPIDARGLQVHGSIAEELVMEDQAEATGGHAIFNTNGLADAAKHIADSDSSFYTLIYSPQDVKLDNRWHNVKVEVDGHNYELSYRHGYFDDGSSLKHAEGTDRKQLLHNGEVVPEVQTKPIVFQVGVTPVDPAAASSHSNLALAHVPPPKKGEHTYSLRLVVPVNAFPVQVTNGTRNVTLGLALLAFNQVGRPVERVTESVMLGASEEQINVAGPSPQITFEKDINLPEGQDFLDVGVWNTETGRLGTVQIPIVVGKAHTH